MAEVAAVEDATLIRLDAGLVVLLELNTPRDERVQIWSRLRTVQSSARCASS